MENLEIETTFEKKRARVDSVTDSPPRKRLRVDSVIDSSATDLCRANSFDSVNSSYSANSVDSVSGPAGLNDGEHAHPELLDVLDDTDLVNDSSPAIPELDSVMRSLQEEILAPESATAEMMTSVTGEMQPETKSDPGEASRDLDYLLEASDDELGLPPRSSPSIDDRQADRNVNLDPTRFGNVGSGLVLDFGDERLNYDPFDLEIGGGSEDEWRRFDYDNGSDFLLLDGLFDHSDSTDRTWLPESLSALH